MSPAAHRAMLFFKKHAVLCNATGLSGTGPVSFWARTLTTRLGLPVSAADVREALANVKHVRVSPADATNIRCVATLTSAGMGPGTK